MELPACKQASTRPECVGRETNADVDVTAQTQRSLKLQSYYQVVKVFWHKAASPPHRDGSVVFFRRRQCAPHILFFFHSYSGLLKWTFYLGHSKYFDWWWWWRWESL